jgi:hypothetical protein
VCHTDSYGGAASRSAAGGVAATVTLVDVERVHSGHVAAWVGVGGPSLGPGGSDAWIQVGVNGFPGGSTGNLYLEIKRGAFYRYAHLADGVAPATGTGLRCSRTPPVRSGGALPSTASRRGGPVFLPGSHGRWPAQIAAESWLEGSTRCNGFAFRFSDVAVRNRDARGLTSLTHPVTFADDGIRLSRAGTGFTVRSSCS